MFAFVWDVCLLKMHKCLFLLFWGFDVILFILLCCWLGCVHVAILSVVFAVVSVGIAVVHNVVVDYFVDKVIIFLVEVRLEFDPKYSYRSPKLNTIFLSHLLLRPTHQ